MNWLFRFFVFLGSLVVIVLFSALLAPYFINWEQFTTRFEQQASRLVGQPVKVGGQSNLRLLPLPFISFEDLEVGRNEDGSPLMTVERFSLNAELFPFLSGEVRIVEMAMMRPQVNLKVAENGTIAWTQRQELPVNPEQINIEKLSITNGSVIVDGLAGKRRLTLENIAGNLSARSVLGPWRIDANADIEDVPTELKISTGTFQQNEKSIRLKIEASRFDQPYRISLDGPVKLRDQILNWNGEFSLTPFSDANVSEMARPVQPLPVRTDGSFYATPQFVEIAEYRMEIGDREDPYAISGQGKISIDENIFFRIQADGRQIDLDRLEQAQGNRNPPTFESRLSALRSVLERIPVPSSKGEIDALLPAVVAGDTFIREIKAVVRPHEKGWGLRSFSAVFPGNTLVEANGRLGLHENFGFAGKVLIASRQPSGLAAWLSGDVDAQIRRLKVLGLASYVTLTPKQARFDNLELRMDDAVLGGKLQRLAPVNGRAALITEFHGNRVNIQDLLALYSLTRDPSDTKLASHDLDIKIKADMLEAQLFERPVFAGGVDAHFRVKDGNVSIERLNADNFYNANIKSSGRLEQVLESPDGNFSLEVRAPDAEKLLNFVDGFTGEHVILGGLQSDKTLTQNTALNLELDTRSTGNGARGQLLVNGTSGGTLINTRIAFNSGSDELSKMLVDSSTTFSNESAGILARQFAIDTLPEALVGSAPGPVKFNVDLKGRAAEGFTTNLALSTPATNLSAKGQTKFINSQDAELDYDVTLGSANIAPYLVLAGIPVPGVSMDSKLPASMRMKLQKKSPSISYKSLSGQIAGNVLTGDLEYQYAQIQRPRLTGKINLTRIPVPLIAGSVYGFADLLGAGMDVLGAEREFGDASFAGYDARISVDAEEIDTGLGFTGTDAVAELVMLDGALDINNLAFNAFGGKFDGSASLKNVDRTVLGTLRYSLSGAGLPGLLEISGLPSVAEGMVSINGSSETSGRSLAAMIANLSGNGIVSVKDAKLEGVDPDSFDKILLASDVDGFEITPGKTANLVDETVLDSGIEAGFIDAPFSITRGRASIRNISHVTKNSDLNGSIEIDMSASQLAAKIGLAFKPGRRDLISGADPIVRVSWNGPFNAPARVIDAGQLEGYLSLRAFENSQRRVETLEAQVIEKQRIQREIAFNFAREKYNFRKEEEARHLREEMRRQWEEAERLRLEEAVQELKDEQGRKAEEARLRKEAERKRKEEEQRLIEEQNRLEEQARLEAERQAAARKAAEESTRQQALQENQAEQIQRDEDSIAPSLRESIIQNIEDFLKLD
ncbi:MAG: AsmA-like C-terminal region-containing protein [Rhizobiaceae bacterium]